MKSVALGVKITNYLQGYSFEENMFRWEDENGKTDSVKMVGMVGDSDFIPALGLTLLKRRNVWCESRPLLGWLLCTGIADRYQ